MVDKENPLYYTDSNGKTRKLGRFEKTKYAEERFEPNIKKGLNDFQIKSRVHDRLVNKSNKSYTKSYWKIFTDNFLTFFNIVLYIIAAALISVGKLSSCLFVVIQFANIFIGVYQDIRAKKLIDRMKLVTEAKAEVVRNGNITTIKATDIVLDEIVVLENGKQITVDGVVVDGYIEVNESLITGESKAIKKNPGDAVFAGSFVTAGSAYIRADKIGVDTFAQQLQQKAKVIKKPTSELLNSLNTIFRWISFAIVPFAIFAIFGNYFAQEGTFDGFFTSLSNKALWKNVIGSTAGSLVSMIPAGIFLLTSTTLTVGLIRLSKKRAFVQELYSIESLARVDVLCLDKTGTITDGTMEVSNVFPMKDVTSEDVEMIMGSYLKAVGDNNMTSLALKKRFTFNDKLKAKTVIPFSSDRKCSAVYFKDQGTYALGAPDYIYKGKDKKIKDTLNMYINSGHRVLMLAHSDLPIAKQVIPSTLEPVAIIVLVDHIRDDAIDTIRWFQENDVQIRIISGDNPASVSAIANSVGIKNADKFISLEGMSIAQVESIAVDYTVFGRVSPEQKAAIIRILRRTGHTPAMVGDGVNDILALKEADCSVAMAAGSDAAKDAAHIILLDSNFSVLPSVVEEGRRVINNLQNVSSVFLVKTVFSITFTFIWLILEMLPIEAGVYPFNPEQMYIWEILSIGLAAFFLALQPNKARVNGSFLKNVAEKAVPGGIIVTALVSACYTLCKNGLYGLSTDNFTELGSLLMYFLSFVILFRVCYPFNKFKAIVYSGILGTATLCLVLNEFLVKIDGRYVFAKTAESRCNDQHFLGIAMTKIGYENPRAWFAFAALLGFGIITYIIINTVIHFTSNSEKTHFFRKDRM